MARLSIVFLLALLSAPLNVVAQNGNPAVVVVATGTGTGAVTVSIPAAANGGGTGGTATVTGDAVTVTTGTETVMPTGTGTETGAGSGNADKGNGTETGSVVDTVVTGVTAVVTTIAATTIEANGTQQVIDAQTLTSSKAITYTTEITEGAAGATSTSKAFGNHNANVEFGFVAGIVMFLAAGL